MSRTLVPVSRVRVEERAATLGKRSIKNEAKRQGILLATSMFDLTTLEGAAPASPSPRSPPASRPGRRRWP